jgi:hypothetical protein
MASGIGSARVRVHRPINTWQQECVMQLRSCVRVAGAAAMLAFTLFLAGCGGLEGSTYEAKEPGGNGTLTLTFVDAEQCKLAMGGDMGKLEFTTKYSVESDKVTIQAPIPGEDPLVLTKSGSTLSGNMDGDAVTFEKK